MDEDDYENQADTQRSQVQEELDNLAAWFSTHADRDDGYTAREIADDIAERATENDMRNYLVRKGVEEEERAYEQVQQNQYGTGVLGRIRRTLFGESFDHEAEHERQIKKNYNWYDDDEIQDVFARAIEHTLRDDDRFARIDTGDDEPRYRLDQDADE